MKSVRGNVMVSATAVVCMLALGTPVASTASSSAELPGPAYYDADGNAHASRLLSADELEEIASIQSISERERILSMAAEGLEVQVLLDFSSTSNLPVAAVALDTGSKVSAMNAQLTTASIAGWSDHRYAGRNATYSYRPNVMWTGSRPGAYQVRNTTSKSMLVGPSSTNWSNCPGYTTCTFATITLGFVRTFG